MSESMIIWFLFVYLEIGRKYGGKDDRQENLERETLKRVKEL